MSVQQKDQLDLFSAQSVEKSAEMEMLLDLESQQDNLRRGIFRRYHEHNERLRTLETMVLDLVQILKYYENSARGAI